MEALLVGLAKSISYGKKKRKTGTTDITYCIV